MTVMTVMTAAVVTALGISGAHAQQSIHYKTWPEALRQVEQSGTVPPGWSATAPITAGTQMAHANPLGTDNRVVITYGKGGVITEHVYRFMALRDAGAKVEVRGPCYSACTLLLSYVAADNLCIAPGAFMAFHAVRSMERGHRMDYETGMVFYMQMPPVIKMWIDDNGGYGKLPLDGYWTLYDRQLWAMGYPRCTP